MKASFHSPTFTQLLVAFNSFSACSLRRVAACCCRFPHAGSPPELPHDWTPVCRGCQAPTSSLNTGIHIQAHHCKSYLRFYGFYGCKHPALADDQRHATLRRHGHFGGGESVHGHLRILACMKNLVSHVTAKCIRKKNPLCHCPCTRAKAVGPGTQADLLPPGLMHGADAASLHRIRLRKVHRGLARQVGG